MTTGLVVLVVVLVGATAFGLLKQRYDGRFRAKAGPTPDAGHVPSREILAPTDIGARLGGRATLVQFSSAFCAPCRATRQILRDVAGHVTGVEFAEVDAESNLALVRRLDIRRTPTVLVLDAHGAVVNRASGQPRRADVIAALGRVLEGADDTAR